MAVINNKHLVVSLIKDDLIHTKLVNGLDALGLDTLHYHIHLSETVFDLLGFADNENTDKIFEYYLSELKKANKLNLRKNREAFDRLATSIYQELKKKKG